MIFSGCGSYRKDTDNYDEQSNCKQDCRWPNCISICKRSIPMQNNKSKIISLYPEIENLKASCFIQHNVPSHENMERNQSVFGSYF